MFFLILFNLFKKFCYFSNYDYKPDYPADRHHDDLRGDADLPVLPRVDQRQEGRTQEGGGQH